MNEDTMNDRDICVSIGKIEEESQITTRDTGWSEEEKEHMRQGYTLRDLLADAGVSVPLARLEGLFEKAPKPEAVMGKDKAKKGTDQHPAKDSRVSTPAAFPPKAALGDVAQ